MQTETNDSVPAVAKEFLQGFFDKYRWIHLALGLIGNLLFFTGSVLFLFDQQLQSLGVWGFVVGSFLMLVGSFGEVLVKYARADS